MAVVEHQSFHHAHRALRWVCLSTLLKTTIHMGVNQMERSYKGWIIRTRLIDGTSQKEFWVYPPNEVYASDVTDRLWTAKALIDAQCTEE